jgi:hypothetical protein
MFAKSANGLREVFAGKLARAIELNSQKFQPVRFGAPKTFHGQRKTLFGMIGNCEHARRQIVIFRPQMQERFFTFAAYFPRQGRQGRYTRAILMQVRGPGGGKLAQACFQFGGELHRGIIVQISI